MKYREKQLRWTTIVITVFIASGLLFFCGCYRCQTSEKNEQPGQLHASEKFTDTDYEQHVTELKKKVPEGFTIIVQKPFVVIGNETPEKVEQRAVKTIKWTVDMIKQDYFEVNPVDIIDIWLFKDESSYKKYAKEIFGDAPGTPFGYYSETDKSLVMNISTGGGTLVHEIVHPFMHSNFPECPAWFNEGLASLYEQCMEKNGHIYGKTNWRLEGLQDAIKKGNVPSFQTLTSMSDNAFYTEDRGTNYGQARYLCYYLQEKELLVKFYHEFCEESEEDPTGYKTLKKLLGEEDMKAFKKRWEEFVLNLTFP